MRLSWLVFVGCLMVSGSASAQQCTNDDDCPNTECGGQVCNWPGRTCGNPTGAASTGWCQTTEDCKCKGLGATCAAPYCTFTVPPPDLLGADFSPPPDLKPPADLTPKPPDLVPPPDLFGVAVDLTAVPDLSTPDLAVPSPDLSVAPVDMGAAKTDLSSSYECDHDTECPNTACGGQVCRWTDTSQLCVAAGTDPQGTDGWCNNDDECKCKGEGATCNLTTLHCTATLPKTAGKDKSGCSVTEPASAGALACLLLGALLLARQLGQRKLRPVRIK